MDPNSWAARLTSASKRYQSAIQSRSEMLMGFEEVDMEVDNDDDDDDIREEYPCPFCTDYFDIVGLCCHIDEEHNLESNNGVCPVCAMRVSLDMVAHITWHHGNIFKMQHHKKKSRKPGSHSTLSLLRRELREGNLQSLFGGSSRLLSSTTAAPDPLLSSFILPMAEDFDSVPSHSSTDSVLVKKSRTDSISERKTEQPPMSIKDKEEKTKRCDFVQGLVLSMMFED